MEFGGGSSLRLLELEDKCNVKWEVLEIKFCRLCWQCVSPLDAAGFGIP